MVPCLSFGSVFDCTTDLYWKWSFISLSLVSFSRKYLFRHSIAALASTDVTGLLSTISISSSLLVSSFSAALMYGQPARMVNFCWTRPRTLQAGSTVAYVSDVVLKVCVIPRARFTQPFKTTSETLVKSILTKQPMRVTEGVHFILWLFGTGSSLQCSVSAWKRICPPSPFEAVRFVVGNVGRVYLVRGCEQPCKREATLWQSIH